MAKKSMIARMKKKSKLISKYAAKRANLKKIIAKSTDFEEVHEAQLKLQKLPVNSSKVRHNRTCQQCGRPHAVYKKFGLCRICLREQQNNGNVPGARKSSW